MHVLSSKGIMTERFYFPILHYYEKSNTNLHRYSGYSESKHSEIRLDFENQFLGVLLKL